MIQVSSNFTTIEVLKSPQRVANFDWFGNSNEFISYTTFDEKMRPSKVYLLNTMLSSSSKNQQQEILLYEEKDPSFYVNVYQTKDKVPLALLVTPRDSWLSTLHAKLQVK